MERTPVQTKRFFYCCRGLTLVEMTLALLITAMATVAVAAMMKAVTDTWAANQQDDQTLVSAQNALKRLRTIIAEAKLFGQQNSETLVLWAGDKNGDFQIEYLECAMLQYDEAADQLQFWDIYFPPGTSQALVDARNVAVSPEVFGSSGLATLLKADAYGRKRILADEVTAFSVSLIGQSPYIRTAMFAFALGGDDPEQQFDTVASMRSPAYYLLDEKK